MFNKHNKEVAFFYKTLKIVFRYPTSPFIYNNI